MRTTEQAIFDNQVLRLMLEQRKPGCTAKCPVAGFDYDAIVAEETALLAIKSAIGSSAAVYDRGANVAAKYQNATQRIAAAGGVKAFNLKSEIAKLEALAAGKTGATKAGLASKLTKLRSELSQVTAKQ